MATCTSFTHYHSCGHNPSSSRSTKRSTAQRAAQASVGTPHQESTSAFDFRRVLGVGPNASKHEVKTAYRRLALQFHPDVCKGDQCDTRFMEANRAYETLMNLFSSSGFQPPQGEPFTPYGSHASMHYGFQAAESATSAEEDDPWADFLQSLVNGTYEELREVSPYENLRSSAASFEGNW